MMSDLSLRGVTKTFGATIAVSNIDLDIAAGEFVVFVGPSGCGKSTLLRLIAGLETVSAGTIRIGGRDVTSEAPGARGLAMVFQSYALYPHMTVAENLGFPLEMQGLGKADIDRRVAETAKVLQLDQLLERKPRALSGGQRQRVAIGRAIVREPVAFLFDEPLSNLDAELRVQMRLEIARLHRSLGKTMIYVTHDQVEAMTLADRIVVLRAGRIEQTGASMELYQNPANAFVAGFIGSPRMNFLPAVLRRKGRKVMCDVHGTSIDVKMPGHLPEDGTPVQLGIRPEHLKAATGPSLAGRCEQVERLGATGYMYVRLADGSFLTCEVDPQSGLPELGSTVSVPLDSRHALLFDAAGERLA
jgi:lactose/L-arabinose transport system ATP-binding protein